MRSIELAMIGIVLMALSAFSLRPDGSERAGNEVQEADIVGRSEKPPTQPDQRATEPGIGHTPQPEPAISDRADRQLPQPRLEGVTASASAQVALGVSDRSQGEAVSGRSGEPSVEVPPPTPPEPRPFRRRFRNRYPGPIPTPADWVPPDGPVRIGLQAGHWRAAEAPGELSGLKDGGTSWGGTSEWEVNLDIARRAGKMLETMGYQVDILPAVVPPSYRAHLFISIHADGSGDPRASGYRVAAPRRDATGRAAQVANLLEESYGEATGLKRLPTVTRRMSNYYAFNFRRYEHALHPMTIAAIIETGFLTSEGDREVIVSSPERAARGIVSAVTKFSVTPPPRITATGGQ